MPDQNFGHHRQGRGDESCRQASVDALLGLWRSLCDHRTLIVLLAVSSVAAAWSGLL